MTVDRTVAERQRRQALRDRAAGISRVTVKVPVEDADLIRRLAERRRIRKLLAQPFPPEDDTP